MKKNNNPIIALAPMDGVTDYPFRTMIEKYSPLVNTFFTEFVPVQGFFSKPELFIPKLLFNRSINKINILQVFGKASQYEYFKKITHIAKYAGFNGIDLNVGCPDREIVKSGAGCALINDEKSVRQIIDSIKQANKETIDVEKNIKELIDFWRNKKGLLNEPNEKLIISIKTRTGINKIEDDKWWKFINSLNLDFISIHFRTQKQGYAGSPNWSQGAKLVKLMKTPIIGNGDIGKVSVQYAENSMQKILENKLKYTPSGIMIGRAFMGNPALLSENPSIITRELQLKYLEEHLALEKQVREVSENTSKRLINMYIRNFEGSKELRSEMMGTNEKVKSEK